ncbi:MAG: thiamine-phosphate kinase [Geminicoccaceae bacterium]
MAWGEFELIETCFKPLAISDAALGLTDDGALLPPTDSGRQLVIVKDALVAGVHFLESDPPATIGAKALAVNLSDLAAMGAEPLVYLLALMRPRSFGDEALSDLVAGLASMQERHSLSLIGGDTVATPGPLALSITAVGWAPPSGAVRRSGARPSDKLWVSGTLGDAALGLRLLQKNLALGENAKAYAIDRYRSPQPKTELGRALAGVATAMIDVSDGLVQDAGHLASASGVALVIHGPAIPLWPGFRQVPEMVELALTGGDDYQLLFTAPADATSTLAEIGVRLDETLSCIGEVEAGSGVRVLSAEGEDLTPTRRGWNHAFSDDQE